MKYYLLSLYIFLNLSLTAKKGERIFIENINTPNKEKEAILILPGFGSKVHGTKDIADYFFNKGYDVYIPDYISRNSIATCVTNIDNFILKHKLKEYKKIHVFSYVIGSWTINNWIMQHPENNISTIVYDRSPLQERAPYALIKDIPVLIRMAFGKIMKEFSNTPYPTITAEQITKGVLIESFATKLIVKHKKSAMLLGPVSWDVADLKQDYTDKCYILLDHDQVYTEFDFIGNEIFYFIKNKTFSEKAKREPYTHDPFNNLR